MWFSVELGEVEPAEDLGDEEKAKHQFKKVKGLTPSHFNQLREIKRISLDAL